jgi:hypothetical protein
MLSSKNFSLQYLCSTNIYRELYLIRRLSEAETTIEQMNLKLHQLEKTKQKIQSELGMKIHTATIFPKPAGRTDKKRKRNFPHI